MSELKTTSLSHKDNNTGTPNITMYPDGTTSLPGTVLNGLRNQLINGAYRIAQRGTSATETTAGYRTLDRWFVGRLASCEEEQVNNAALEQEAGTSNSMRLTPGNAGDIRQMIEIVEGEPSQFQIGTTWTLSFYCNRENTSLSIGFADGVSGGGNYVNVVSASTAPQRVGTTNQYTHTFTITSNPNGTNKGLRVILSPSSSEYTDFTGAQLEPGPVATPFELRPIGLELSLCQRYYETISDMPMGARYNSTTNFYRVAAAVINMRTSPTTAVVTSTNLSTIQVNASSGICQMFGVGAGETSATQISVTLDAEL